MIDTNECSINTCGALTSCTDSASDTTIPLGKYKCTCIPGNLYADKTTTRIYVDGTAAGSVEDCSTKTF